MTKLVGSTRARQLMGLYEEQIEELLSIKKHDKELIQKVFKALQNPESADLDELQREIKKYYPDISDRIETLNKASSLAKKAHKGAKQDNKAIILALAATLTALISVIIASILLGRSKAGVHPALITALAGMIGVPVVLLGRSQVLHQLKRKKTSEENFQNQIAKSSKGKSSETI